MRLDPRAPSPTALSQLHQEPSAGALSGALAHSLAGRGSLPEPGAGMRPLVRPCSRPGGPQEPALCLPWRHGAPTPSDGGKTGSRSLALDAATGPYPAIWPLGPSLFSAQPGEKQFPWEACSWWPHCSAPPVRTPQLALGADCSPWRPGTRLSWTLPAWVFTSPRGEALFRCARPSGVPRGPAKVTAPAPLVPVQLPSGARVRRAQQPTPVF